MPGTFSGTSTLFLLELKKRSCPKTFKGAESEQTKKIVSIKEKLEKNFTKINWVLWDERLSSKRAQQMQINQKDLKEKKHKEHSIAAAFILQSYLDYTASH